MSRVTLSEAPWNHPRFNRQACANDLQQIDNNRIAQLLQELAQALDQDLEEPTDASHARLAHSFHAVLVREAARRLTESKR